MHARRVRFSFGPEKRAEAQAIADDLAPSIASQPGCEGITVFGDHTDGEYGIFVLWASQDHAEAAAQVAAAGVGTLVLTHYIPGLAPGADDEWSSPRPSTARAISCSATTSRPSSSEAMGLDVSLTALR